MPPKSTEEPKLRENADELPLLCRQHGCAATKLQARGLCSPHYALATRKGALDRLALPSTPRGERSRKAAPAEPHRRAAVPMVNMDHPTVQAKINDAERRELEQLRASDARLRDALAQSADKLQVVVATLNLDPTADLLQQTRDIAAWMQAGVDAAKALGATNPTELRQAANDTMQDTHLNALKKLQTECDACKEDRAALIDDAGASETELVRWRAGVWAVADRLEVPRGEPDVVPDCEILAAIDKLYADRAVLNAAIREQAAALAGDEPVGDATASRLYEVFQTHGSYFPSVFGYVDAAGFFRGENGVVIGSIGLALPKVIPELGEPVAGDVVWTRTKIREVTAIAIYTTDGGRYQRSEWTPNGFVRPATSVKIHD